MEIVKINGIDHLKIGNSYYTEANINMLIQVGEKTINLYNTSHTQDECEVLSDD